jgi:hypothetical protein
MCERAHVRCGCVPGRLGFYMCVRACTLAYSAFNAHAPYCDVICGVCGSIIFLDILINSTIFGKALLGMKCEF